MVTNKRAKVDHALEPVAGPSKVKAPTREVEEDSEDSNDNDEEQSNDSSSEEEESASEGLEGEDDEDDEDEIRQANEEAHTQQKKKRKRALPSTVFGSVLSSLIAAPAPSRPLKPLHAPPSEEALERRALKLLQANKHEREERGHVSDVIAGWTARPNIPFSQWNNVNLDDPSVEYTVGGGDKEKELRRLAQKGAVRLFNAIKAAQATTLEGSPAPMGKPAAIKSGATRAIKEASPAVSDISSKAHDPASSIDKRKSNLLGGRGKQEACK